MSRTIETLKNQVKDMHSALVTDIYQSLREDPEWNMELQDMIYYNDFTRLNEQVRLYSDVSPAQIDRLANARESKRREEEKAERLKKEKQRINAQRYRERVRLQKEKEEKERQRQIQIRNDKYRSGKRSN
jgi:hypothetical protein